MYYGEYSLRDMQRQNGSYDYNQPQYKGNKLLGIWIPWILFFLFVGTQIPWKTLIEHSRKVAKQQAQIAQNFTAQRQHELTSMLAAKSERAKQLGKTYTPQIYANDCLELRRLSYKVPVCFEEMIDRRIRLLHSLCLEHYQPHVIGRAVTMKKWRKSINHQKGDSGRIALVGQRVSSFYPNGFADYSIQIGRISSKIFFWS